MFKLGLVAFVWLFFISVHGSEISHLRDDRTIPEKCHQIKVSDFFAPDLVYMTYSRTGGRKRGFDKEYPIGREVIRKLWRIFKDNSHHDASTKKWLRSNKKILSTYKILKDNYQDMDFDFTEEGQILELLAIIDLRQEIDLNKYFITGSVAYSGDDIHRRLGELDLVVAEIQTCKVIAVGEVKVNPKRLSLAKSQLARFRRFLDKERGR